MIYAPSAWGREFHSLDVNEAMGGGSAGPGKSLVLLHDPLPQAVVEHERCRVGEIKWGESTGWAMHMRRELPRLQQTMDRAFRLFPSIWPDAKWNSQLHMWTLPSGYKFQFGHLKDNDSFLNYRSSEYTHLGIDEIGELDSKDVYDEMVLRVRSTDPVLSKMLKVRSMTNPCANWVRELFVDPAPEGRAIFRRKIRMEDGTYEERTRLFLPARLSDNPDPMFRRQYEANLRDKPAHIRAALLDGNWYVVAGAFFADDWDPSRVVIKPFKIPADWKRFRSGDWGYKQPTVILWWAMSPEGELICYRERTFNGPKAKTLMYADEVAEAIKEIEQSAGEWNNMRGCSRLTGPMDTQLWEERGRRGPCMADDMARVGVYWTRATKGRRMAAMQVVRRLKRRGYMDRPGIMFFENCQNCIRTIPALNTDNSQEANGEVPLKGGPDHWYDAVSYACSANMVPNNVGEAMADDDDDEGGAAPVRRGYGSMN
jgi:hypothetical protein